MTREQRAKQFMPFDAMKGLQEALRDREERHSRVERHGISEEEQEALSNVLNRLSKGDKIRISYYCHFHDVEKSGTVTVSRSGCSPRYSSTWLPPGTESPGAGSWPVT